MYEMMKVHKESLLKKKTENKIFYKQITDIYLKATPNLYHASKNNYHYNNDKDDWYNNNWWKTYLLRFFYLTSLWMLNFEKIK